MKYLAVLFSIADFMTGCRNVTFEEGYPVYFVTPTEGQVFDVAVSMITDGPPDTTVYAGEFILHAEIAGGHLFDIDSVVWFHVYSSGGEPAGNEYLATTGTLFVTVPRPCFFLVANGDSLPFPLIREYHLFSAVYRHGAQPIGADRHYVLRYVVPYYSPSHSSGKD